MIRRLTSIALVALAAAPAQAAAAPADVAATHVYIQANYALARAGVARIGTVQSKIKAFNNRLAGECSGVGTGSPETEAAQPMSYEVAVALWSVSYGANASSIAAFAKATRGLHWSNAAITRKARAYASSLHELSTLATPGLCTDVRAWTASGFQTVPPNVRSLDARVEAIEPQTVPQHLLAPYAQGPDASIATKTAGLEMKLAESEFMLGQDDWYLVLGTLGLQP